MKATELMGTPNPEQDRLDSWKQIAAFLNKSERTVRRWQETEGLPVHKHPHQQRGSVWAYRQELDHWLTDRVVRPEPAPVSPPRPNWRNAIAAGVFLAAILGLVLSRRNMEPARMPDPVPLTTLPGAEYGASFSPDGQQVVFVWAPHDGSPVGLYVKRIDEDKVTPLAVSAAKPRTLNYSPAWSPDGRTIAFLSRTPELETWLILISANGGPQRKLILISTAPTLFFADHKHVSWSPDSQWVFVPMALSEAERGIYRVSAMTGTATAIVKGVSNYAPAVSPDGRFLVSLRTEGFPLSFQEVLLHKLNPRGLVEGSPVSIYQAYSMSSGIAWMPDSKTLLFCNSDTTFFGPFDTSLYRLPAVSHARGTSIGGVGCSSVAVSRQGLVVYGSASHARSIMLQGSLRALEPARRFNASSRYDSCPAFSPDANALAFYSNRSGRPEIWVAKPDGTGLRRITENSLVRSCPAWSPDGSRIVYVSGHSLAISPLAGGMPVSIDVGGTAHNPVWSADGQSIYYSSGFQLWRIGVDGTRRRLLASSRSIVSLVENPDGRTLYFTRIGRPFALCQIPTDGGSEQIIEDGLTVGSIAVTRRSLYFVRAQGAVYGLPLSGGSAKEIAAAPALGGEGTSGWDFQFTVSPDDSTIVWTLIESHETDLELLRP